MNFLEYDSVYKSVFPAQVLTPGLALGTAGRQLEFVFGLLPIPCVLGLALLQLICFLHHLSLH